MAETKEQSILRVCKVCGQTLPATSEYFAVYKPKTPNRSVSLDRTCRPCRYALNKIRRENSDPDFPAREALRQKRRAAQGEGLRFCAACSTAKPSNTEHFYERRHAGKVKLSGFCKPCTQRTAKKKRAKQTEQDREGRRRRYWERRDEICEKRRQYRQTSEAYKARLARPDVRAKQRVASLRWINANKERVAARTKAWKQEGRNDPEWVERRKRVRQDYYRRNSVAIRARTQVRRAKRRAAPGIYSSQDIHELFKRQGGRCFYCERKIGWGHPWQVDHFIPLARGGTNYPDNLRLACETCNRAKWAKLPWEFLPDRFPPPTS